MKELRGSENMRYYGVGSREMGTRGRAVGGRRTWSYGQREMARLEQRKEHDCRIQV